MAGKIRITEKFKTIQGEGPLLGRPSYFIRVWGCNLHCSWCDSKHSWEFGMKEAKLETVDSLVEDILRLYDETNIRNIVFTGGEPMLFKDKIAEVIGKVNDSLPGILIPMNFTIESNGEIIPENDEFFMSNVLFSLSTIGGCRFNIQCQYDPGVGRTWSSLLSEIRVG